ncbi:MAG: chain-length determining protein [Desulfobacteraceae bacterium]|nr:chain-length determining protein [Desulfobacteraceae bacterium]
MEEIVLTPSDYLAILKRRLWSLVLPMILVVVAAACVALLLPAIYKSTSIILIEKQEIPSEYVMSSMTSYAEQRIQSINQRVMTSSKLLDLINRFDLYSELRSKKTMDEIIEKMREDIHLAPVTADVADQRSGRSVTATIAFTISYEGKDSAKVQQVTNTITSLFLKEDLSVREQQAEDTYSFLDDEKNKVRKELAEYEKKIALFKQEHIESLPEVFQVNMQTLNSLQQSVERVKENLRSLRERKGYLETQLVNVSPDLESDNDDSRRLEALKMQLINLKTKFSDEYPDVAKLKTEIEEVEKSVAEKKKEKAGLPDNPAYITLSSQLSSTRTDIESVKNQIKDLDIRLQEYKDRIEATPSVEEAYGALLADRNNLKAKYDDLQRKSMEAKVAQGLQAEQKGERFTLIEPARRAEKPFKPNRLAIVLIGIVLGLGAGVGYASLREFADSSFRDPESIMRATGFTVLTVIPEIVTQKDRARRRRKKLVIVTVLAVGAIASIFLFDMFVMDLDVLWAKILRKIS